MRQASDSAKFSFKAIERAVGWILLLFEGDLVLSEVVKHKRDLTHTACAEGFDVSISWGAKGLLH
jgi:hypothetical protein